jgi:hypothetical protein
VNARPYVARTRTELGLLTGDRALVEQGQLDLEALGDIDQAGRVAAERTSGAAWLARSKAGAIT